MGAGETKEFRHLCDNWIYVSDLAVLTIELLSVLTVERWRMVNLNKELGNEGHTQKNWPSHKYITKYLLAKLSFKSISVAIGLQVEPLYS